MGGPLQPVRFIPRERPIEPMFRGMVVSFGTGVLPAPLAPEEVQVVLPPAGFTALAIAELGGAATPDDGFDPALNSAAGSAAAAAESLAMRDAEMADAAHWLGGVQEPVEGGLPQEIDRQASEAARRVDFAESEIGNTFAPPPGPPVFDVPPDPFFPPVPGWDAPIPPGTPLPPPPTTPPPPPPPPPAVLKPTPPPPTDTFTGTLVAALEKSGPGGLLWITHDAVVHWQTGAMAAQPVQVYVSTDGSPWTLFAESPSGSQTAAWMLQSGHVFSWELRLGGLAADNLQIDTRGVTFIQP